MSIKRWIEWSFGCLLGLLPLGAWIFAHRLAGLPQIVGAGATRELLFFALTTSCTGLISLGEERHPGRSPLWTIGLVFTILSAVFYGEFLTGEAVHAAIRVRFAYNTSRWFAVAAFIYGAAVEAITQWRSSQ